MVDDCTLRIQRKIASLTSVVLSDFEQCIHSELLDFRKNECTTTDRRTLKFVVCALAYQEQPRQFQAWVHCGSRLQPVESFAVAGWESELYKHVAERLFRRGMRINQATFAALYLLKLAGDTSLYVGGPTKLIAVRESGMWPCSPENAKKLSDRMDMFGKQLDSLMLFCPDTSITKKEFSRKLQEFEETVTTLREDYLQESAEAMLRENSIR